MRNALLSLALVALAFAGCTDEPAPTPALTEEDCAALGLILGERDVMDDHGGDAMEGESNETGNGTDDAMADEGHHHTEPACVEEGPPASVTLEGFPATASRWSEIAFQWVLHTDGGENHAMDTQVRMDFIAAEEGELGMPDSWGSKIAQFEHQNFVDGQTYEATHTFEQAGVYYLRAYAVVSGHNIWSDEVVIDITEPLPTGTGHTLTLSGGGIPLASSISNADLDIELGDSVGWVTDDPAGTWTIESDSGPVSFTATAGGDPVVFLRPGNYAYTATGTLTGSVSGQITVASPPAPTA